MLSAGWLSLSILILVQDRGQASTHGYSSGNAWPRAQISNGECSWMDANKDVTTNPSESEDTTLNIIDQTLKAAAEGLTGIAASDRKALAMSLGHILQRMRGGSFLSQVKKEWGAYREQGRIKDNYLNTTQHKECFQELLDFLDGESPDEVRFEALKSIFLRAATEEETDRSSVLPQQYMRIIRSLSAGEVILLAASYKYPSTDGAAVNWISNMASKSPLKIPELVEIHEDALIRKHLITPRMHGDRSGVSRGVHGRLTRLGINICEFIGY